MPSVTRYPDRLRHAQSIGLLADAVWLDGEIAAIVCDGRRKPLVLARMPHFDPHVSF
jgi:hypothetical protein